MNDYVAFCGSVSIWVSAAPSVLRSATPPERRVVFVAHQRVPIEVKV